MYSRHLSPSLVLLGRNGQITAALENITIHIDTECVGGSKPATVADFFRGNCGKNTNGVIVCFFQIDPACHLALGQVPRLCNR